MTKFWRLKPHRHQRERLFNFLERRRRHERWFKRSIVCTTLLTSLVLPVVLPRGRYLLANLASRARQVGRTALFLATSRTAVDEDWQRFRPSRDRRLAAPIERDLRIDRTWLPGPHAIRRARPRSWTPALGQLRSDAPPALDRVRTRRRGPVVPDAAVHRLDLASRGGDPERGPCVLSGPRSSRASRADSSNPGDHLRRLEAIDELLGPSRPGA